jgi:hypothetical protein
MIPLSNIVYVKSRHDRTPGRRAQALAALERDAALGRLSSARRWLIAGAAALTAAIAALVSSVAPGRAASRHLQAGASVGSSAAAPASSTDQTKLPPLASASQLGLQSPSSAPQAAPSQAPPAQAAPAQAAPAQAAPAPVPAAPAPTQAPVATSGGS